MLLWLFLLGLLGGCQCTVLPHISECNYCHKCYLSEEERTAEPGMRKLAQLNNAQWVGVDGNGKLYPTEDEIYEKLKKPNCTECYGCATHVTPLQAVSAFGADFKVEPGASPEWLFVTDLPDSPQQAHKKAIIKVWCMPISKYTGAFKWICANTTKTLELAHTDNQFLLAQQRVLEECGLLDVTVKVWLAPVNAIVPNTGFHIWWDGLWMERAQGISINQLSYITHKWFVRNTTLELLQNKLDHTRLIKAALLDLLTMQCDRHAQNVFINEKGDITLIDNLHALKYSWQHCALDSIFLPGTQMNAVVAFGGDWVLKKQKPRRRRSINPTVLLDYRCHVDGGKIGFNYPPEFKQCLQRLAVMEPEQIKQHYNFPHLRNAQLLQARASDLLNKGFEWTLQHGKPHNMPSKCYKWHPPCCKLTLDKKDYIRCAQPWNIVPEFPLGEPIGSNGTWLRAYPDPGKYDGGMLV